MDLEKHEKLVTRILAGVDEKLRNALRKILQGYDGSHKVLEEVLDKTGNEHIYHAVQCLELFSVEYGEIEKTEKGKRKKKITASASGQALSLAYLFRNKDHSSVTLPLGYQAAPKLFQTFGTSEQEDIFNQTEEKTKQHKKRKETAATETCSELEEIISMPRRSLEAAEDRLGKLSEHIRELGNEIYALLHGSTSFISDPLQRAAIFVPLERGATFAWYKKHMKELPDDVRNSFVFVTDNYLLASTTAYKHHMYNLVQYTMMHRYIDKDAILGSYQKDIDVLLKLAETNPEHDLVKTYGKPDLTRVTDILAKPEITFIEAARVLQSFPVHRIRQEINEQYYQKHKAELEEVLDRLHPLFFDAKETLREDVYRSVPKRMTDESIYALALLQPDLDAVRKYIILSTLGSKKEKTIQHALAMEEYKELADGVVVAARKLKTMNKLLHQKKIVVEDPEHAADFVSKHKSSFAIRGKGYTLIENFEQQFDIPYEEFLDRLTSIQPSLPVIDNKLETMLDQITTGIYRVNDEFEKKLKSYIEEFKKYTLRSTLEEQITKAATMEKHRLYKYTAKMLDLPTLLRKYVSSYEKGNIEKRIAAINEMDTACREYNSETLDRLLALANEMEKTYYVTVDTKENRVNIKVESKHPICKEIDDNVEYVDPTLVEQRNRELNDRDKYQIVDAEVRAMLSRLPKIDDSRRIREEDKQEITYNVGRSVYDSDKKIYISRFIVEELKEVVRNLPSPNHQNRN